MKRQFGNFDDSINMISFTNFLFVPGNRPERFEKAASAGADLICIDLEDSVPGDQKDEARNTVLTSLAKLEGKNTAIRINGLKTKAGLSDLLALVESEHRPSLILLPMIESAAEVEIAQAIIGDKIDGLIPLVETVKGLRAGDEIAASAGVTAMMFGGGDFSAQLGTKLEWEPLLVARSQFIMCCASANIAAVDVPYTDMSDAVGLEEECKMAKQLGFTAKAAIHPKQVATIKTVLRPSDAEIAEAKAAIAAYDEAGGKAISYNGHMLEAPIMERYRRMLASV